MTVLDNVIELVSNMDGVMEVHPLNQKIAREVKTIEFKISGSLNLDVKNTGVQECMNRQHILCIIKNERFRPPPEPTVLLIGDDELIIGKEIIPSDITNYREDKGVLFLSSDFIIFKNRRPKHREYFLMPPIKFPEIESIEGVKSAISCSPSLPADMILRGSLGIKDDPSLASLLIGFNVEK
jgi:hypothetical protein